MFKREYGSVHQMLSSGFNVLPFFIVSLVWTIFFYDGLLSSMSVWWNSTTYNHCFFIVPLTFYLLFKEDVFTQYKNSPIALVLFGLVCTLYLFASIGDIDLLMQIATFSSIPVLIASYIGLKKSVQHFLPLCFFLFAIPFGEELTPWLQVITAQAASALLTASNIPTFTNGLYIEIPKGMFLVAEACSGVRFLISTIVIGFLYSYLFIEQKNKKLLFIALSFLIPVLANFIRVYGIIVIAHLSDMQYAVGADHLIYGWVFYTFVLMIMFYIGNKLAANSKNNSDAQASIKLSKLSKQAKVHSLAICAILGALWIYSYNVASNNTQSSINFGLVISNNENSISSKLRPIVVSPTAESFELSPNHSYIISYFDSTSPGELTSSLNKPYNPDYWNLLHKRVLTYTYSGLNITLNEHELTNSKHQIRYVYTFYIVNNTTTNSPYKAKLIETFNLFTGKRTIGAIVHILSTDKLTQIPESKKLEEAFNALKGE